MSNSDKRLPSRAQIKLITDIPLLEDLRAECDIRIEKMTVDLEMQVGDEDWDQRCRRALAYARVLLKDIQRQLYKVRPYEAPPAAPKGPLRERLVKECDPRTIRVLDRHPQVPDVKSEEFITVEQIDAFIVELAADTNAMTLDREDEIAQGAGRRDEGFLAATGRILPGLRALRQQLQTRRGELTRQTRRGSDAARQETRERLFIDGARALLTGAQYRLIWDWVDRKEMEDLTPT